MKKILKAIKIFAGATIAVLSFSVLVALHEQQVSPQAQAAMTDTSSAPIQGNTLMGAVDKMADGKLSIQKFNRIKAGMTYPQVTKILGDPGVEGSRVEMMGITTVVYEWQNPSGANMNAEFQNGRLIAKAQAGLN